ncbi:unnamed protein product, partial [Mesorhabditis spiculigera]
MQKLVLSVLFIVLCCSPATAYNVRVTRGENMMLRALAEPSLDSFDTHWKRHPQNFDVAQKTAPFVQRQTSRICFLSPVQCQMPILRRK